MSKQYEVPGSSAKNLIKLAVVCPKCLKPLVAEYDNYEINMDTVHCILCSFQMHVLPADTVEIINTCPDCGRKLWAARRAKTHEIDHVWCKYCDEVNRRERLGLPAPPEE